MAVQITSGTEVTEAAGCGKGAPVHRKRVKAELVDRAGARDWGQLTFGDMLDFVIAMQAAGAPEDARIAIVSQGRNYFHEFEAEWPYVPATPQPTITRS